MDKNYNFNNNFRGSFFLSFIWCKQTTRFTSAVVVVSRYCLVFMNVVVAFFISTFWDSHPNDRVKGGRVAYRYLIHPGKDSLSLSSAESILNIFNWRNMFPGAEVRSCQEDLSFIAFKLGISLLFLLTVAYQFLFSTSPWSDFFLLGQTHVRGPKCTRQSPFWT